ncbi:aminoacyl-tRNA hydrolase [Legionella longbeachae]|uniref:aminoacyl-tRNA hydrolase n=1 Tax=Legionella longbeachae TaxID=450 RepID=UPI0001BEBFC9|nr:aminoacyl-tRNA hydrolase [Legionella longbeachae]ARM33351.1 aminoacyl-tRNA hydrolase [Legionella longbeachae]EEZ93776.1 peptidyl-tRNA hydrolase [Legionella longbeachae D-4968]
MAIKLIIGLRNPGPAYEHTRHNAGQWLISALAQRYSIFFKLEKKMQAELVDLELNQHLCKLALPTTFMNHSGQPTRLISQFYRIQPNEILIVHDELDLPAGRIKLKTGGGHGGHNGLRDIIAQLGSAEFHRMRIGIGHPGHKDLVHQFVLSKPTAQERQLTYDAIDRGIAVMPFIFSGDFAKAMNQLNA